MANLRDSLRGITDEEEARARERESANNASREQRQQDEERKYFLELDEEVRRIIATIPVWAKESAERGFALAPVLRLKYTCGPEARTFDSDAHLPKSPEFRYGMWTLTIDPRWLGRKARAIFDHCQKEGLSPYFCWSSPVWPEQRPVLQMYIKW